jgi:hypothetical protein
MNRYLYIFLLILAGCTSNSPNENKMSKVERFIASYESGCLDFQKSMIESKTFSTPEKKQEAIDTALKNYYVAKDTSNPDPVRQNAINQAHSVCSMLKRMHSQ